MMRSFTSLPFVSSALLALISVGALVWLGMHILALTEETARLEEVIAEVVRAESEGHTIKTMLADIEKEHILIASAFLAEEEIVSFLEEIEALGRQAGVELEIQNVDIATPEEGMPELLLSVSAEGGWEGVGGFLLRFEGMPYHVTIQEADIAQSFDDEGPPWSLGLRAAVLMKE